jgi:hypothetical protein
MFKIFEDEYCQSRIPTVGFINFLEFIAVKEPGIPSANVQRINDLAVEEYSEYQTYQRIFTDDETSMCRSAAGDTRAEPHT